MIGLFALLAVSAPPAITCTVASFYGVGDGFHGRTTASGEVFDAYDLTAAHKTLPFGTELTVFSTHTGNEVKVRINDRGPYVEGRGLDLSYAAFKKIENPSVGVAKVCYTTN